MEKSQIFISKILHLFALMVVAETQMKGSCFIVLVSVNPAVEHKNW